MGIDFRKDFEFDDEAMAYMFLFEIDYLMKKELMHSELESLMEYYDIPFDEAQQIIEAATTRYLTQACNMAMLKITRYEDADAMEEVKKIFPYLKYLPVNATVPLDGCMFRSEDKLRLIQAYATELDNQIEDLEFSPGSLTPEQLKTIELLREEKLLLKQLDELMVLDDNYIIPYGEYQGRNETMEASTLPTSNSKLAM